MPKSSLKEMMRLPTSLWVRYYTWHTASNLVLKCNHDEYDPFFWNSIFVDCNCKEKNLSNCLWIFSCFNLRVVCIFEIFLSSLLLVGWSKKIAEDLNTRSNSPKKKCEKRPNIPLRILITCFNWTFFLKAFLTLLIMLIINMNSNTTQIIRIYNSSNTK